MKFKNILLFFIIIIVTTANSISAEGLSSNEDSSENNNSSFAQKSDKTKKSDAMFDELGQKEIDCIPAEMNLEGKIQQLQQEKSNLQEENKQLNEKNNELIRQMDKIVLHQLWKNCIAESKGLEERLSQFKSDLLISNQHIKNMCKTSGWCKGNEDNPSDEFAQNSEQYKDLEWQVKNDLHKNLDSKDNEIKELKQNIAQQKKLNLQKENNLCENLTAKDNEIEKLKQNIETQEIACLEKENDLKTQLSLQILEKEKYLKYIQEFCKQSGYCIGNEEKLLETFFKNHDDNLHKIFSGHNKEKNALIDVSNKLLNRNKELTTSSGAAGILYANFVDTLILHKIKVLASTITTIGGYLLYKKRDRLATSIKKTSTFFSNAVKKLKGNALNFFNSKRSKK